MTLTLNQVLRWTAQRGRKDGRLRNAPILKIGFLMRRIVEKHRTFPNRVLLHLEPDLYNFYHARLERGTCSRAGASGKTKNVIWNCEILISMLEMLILNVLPNGDWPSPYKLTPIQETLAICEFAICGFKYLQCAMPTAQPCSGWVGVSAATAPSDAAPA